MTTMQQTEARTHIDGGTYRELQYAPTANGWGVCLTEWTTYRGNVVYQIHRVSDSGKMMALGNFRTEAEGRAAANRMWALDKRAA